MLYHKTFELGPERDWVVFVHGAGGSSSIWFKQTCCCWTCAVTASPTSCSR